MWWKKQEPTKKEVQEVGRSTWMLLHAIAKYYPSKPSLAHEVAVQSLFSSLAVLYPCRQCAGVFSMAAAHNTIDARTDTALSYSICTLHNFVNRKLHKEEKACKEGTAQYSCVLPVLSTNKVLGVVRTLYMHAKRFIAQ